MQGTQFHKYMSCWEREHFASLFHTIMTIFFCHGSEIWQGGASLEWVAAGKLKSAWNTYSVFTFCSIDTDLRLNGHPSLTPCVIVWKRWSTSQCSLCDVACSIITRSDAGYVLHVGHELQNCYSRIVISTQKLEVLPLVIHTVNHLFEVTVISVIFCSFFFFFWKFAKYPSRNTRSLFSYSLKWNAVWKNRKTKQNG